MPDLPQSIPAICPACDHAAFHTGVLHRETPTSPLINPPVELFKCQTCGLTFRADGVPYDEAARAAAWPSLLR